ncbi:MAG TPA: hypothetical protein VMW49_03130 [Candidatus Dormibacteraeota bacterium]|nr:hypothetical protein [Candidatus Dormibacteraeota bacterium]
MSAPHQPAAPDDLVSWAGVQLRHRTVVLLVVGAAAALAFGLRLYLILRPGHLFGIVQYDDAVYVGAAIRIANGALPYRNFVFDQPPGVPLLLAPLGLLSHLIGSRQTMGAARLLVPLVAAANVGLLGWILRRRAALVAATACLTLAVYPDDLLSSPTVYLEPFLNLFCLLGAALFFDGDAIATSRRRLAWSGAAFGLAGAVKIWAIFPVLVLGLFCLSQPRRLGPWAAGVALGFLVPCAPFLLLAPGSFLHQVVLDQMGRTDVVTVPILARLVLITGVLIVPPVLMTPAQELLGLAAAVGLAAVLAAAFLLLPRPQLGPTARASGWRARRRMSPLERYAVASTVLIVAVFMIPADFFFHYATFLGPFLALGLGLGAGRALPVLREPAAAAVALALFVAVMHATLVVRGSPPATDPGPGITRLIPAGACVVSDDPAYAINADRFVARARGCPLLVDPLAVTLALSGGRVANGGAARSGATVRVWTGYLEHAQYLLLTPSSGRRIPWTAAMERYVRQHFVPVARAPLLILKRGRGGLPGAVGIPLPPIVY